MILYILILVYGIVNSRTSPTAPGIWTYIYNDNIMLVREDPESSSCYLIVQKIFLKKIMRHSGRRRMLHCLQKSEEKEIR